jgi:hypothetical protein
VLGCRLARLVFGLVLGLSFRQLASYRLFSFGGSFPPPFS